MSSIIPTLAEFRARESWGLPPDLATANLQWELYDDAVWRHVEAIRADLTASGNQGMLLHILAEDIIGGHLGTDWYSSHVESSASSRTARNTFISTRRIIA